jgi:hypothetical protein
VKLFGADLVLLPKKEAAKIILILAVGIPLALFVWSQNVRRERSKTESLAFLHSLRADAITGINLSEEHSGILKTITHPSTLEAFSDAVHATEIYEPNHPSYTRNFVATVTFKDTASRRYELHTILSADETIYIDFPHGGSGKSKPLYGWMRSQSLVP